MVYNFHCETVRRARRHRARNTAHADQSKRFVMYTRPHHVSRAPACPFLVPRMTLALARSPGNHQQQGHGEVGSALGQHFRRIRNGETGRLRRFEIDMIESDPKTTDHFGLHRRGTQHFGIDLVRYRW